MKRKHKIIQGILLLLAVIVLSVGLLHGENHLYLSLGLGISYLLWGYSFILSSTFHWYYKAVETIYYTWFVGISAYLFYIEQAWVMTVFLIPHMIHYSIWGKKHEENAIHYMLLEIEEKKDTEKIATFKNEVKNRPYSASYRYWNSSIQNIEKTMREEKNKESE